MPPVPKDKKKKPRSPSSAPLGSGMADRARTTIKKNKEKKKSRLDEIMGQIKKTRGK